MGLPVWGARDPCEYGAASQRGVDFRLSSEVKPWMWTKLVDWMREVCAECVLSSRSFQCAVSALHSFLAWHAVRKSQFQCLGVAALQAAAARYDPGRFSVEQASDICAGGAPLPDVLALQEAMREAFIVRAPARPLCDLLPPTDPSADPALRGLREFFCDAVLGSSELYASVDHESLAQAIHDLAVDVLPSALGPREPPNNAAAATDGDDVGALKRGLCRAARGVARSREAFMHKLHHDAIRLVERSLLPEFGAN